MANIKNIIVVGASAGGLKVAAELVSKLPKAFDAAIFIVLHISKQSVGEVIINHLQKNTSLKCVIPKEGEEFKKGHVYLAPPDHHMLIGKSTIRINKGPHENRWRPSIDVLFRSAAVYHSSRVIGIVLSGLLDDGTSGMAAIKKSGGICIVQEPIEAEFPDMPVNVIKNVNVDYRVPVSDMSYVLDDALSRTVIEGVAVPEEIRKEVEITEDMENKIGKLKEISSLTLFVCPDCGGALWQMKDDAIDRYRCHTGHVFTENVLVEEQAHALEQSLWTSLRLMEERRNLLLSLAAHEEEDGKTDLAEMNRKRAAEIADHAEKLKSVMLTISQKDLIK
jgi:two-component system, chemotaxis family, protein-glutamate methylesterase/glutaminase